MVTREKIRRKAADVKYFVAVRKVVEGQKQPERFDTLHRPDPDGSIENPISACNHAGQRDVALIPLEVETLLSWSDAKLESIDWCQRPNCYGTGSAPASTCPFCGQETSNMDAHQETECPVLNDRSDSKSESDSEPARP